MIHYTIRVWRIPILKIYPAAKIITAYLQNNILESAKKSDVFKEEYLRSFGLQLYFLF